jgi:hypothetical protein
MSRVATIFTSSPSLKEATYSYIVLELIWQLPWKLLRYLQAQDERLGTGTYQQVLINQGFHGTGFFFHQPKADILP